MGEELRAIVATVLGVVSAAGAGARAVLAAGCMAWLVVMVAFFGMMAVMMVVVAMAEGAGFSC